MHNDLDFDLDLSRTAAALDIPPGDVGAVVSRGRRRAHRRRNAVTVMTTVAVVSAAVTGFNLLDRGDQGTPVAAGGGVRRGASGIGWQRVAPGSTIGFARGLDGAGPVYALSTAPGDRAVAKRNPSRVLWRSEDGVDWQSVSKLDDDLFLSDLSVSGDRIYAVGTGPASAAVPGRQSAPDVVVGWSDDGGKTWQKATLPLDTKAIAAGSSSSGVMSVEVAAGAKGAVAVTVPYAVLDVPKLLPSGATAPNGWALTSTGVDVLGPAPASPCPAGTSPEPPLPMVAPGEAVEPAVPATAPPAVAAPPAVGPVPSTFCFRGETEAPITISPQQGRGVAQSYTWDQLGVRGDLLRAARQQPVAFAAGPGSTDFKRVELPDVGASPSPVTAQADDEGFDLIVPAANGPEGLNQAPRIVVLHSGDGRDWRVMDLDSGGVQWVAAAGRLGGRLALIGAGEMGDPLLIRSDGSGGWTTAPLGGVVSGKPGTQLGIVSAAVGPLGVVAVVAVIPDGPTTEKMVTEYRLLVSRDGTAWDDHALDELAGERVGGADNIIVTRDRAVVSAILEQKDPGSGKTIERVTLVGTLG